ncbi:hypothetical protein OM076_01270 [Solirubrobacter ginsenosidimutans]|uniref:Uncharacterized protein n=1 Tax=Solirubrobacter ginsenosidimutans TaxID=490573 RepID=A0A9X3MMH8_9ACTN|nr:hypothetical protein [Solirubrobacter ginsenosidimutans]MDA0158877.1 hypothetical protein [Solirubrobacter ginsenosidimutans]
MPAELGEARVPGVLVAVAARDRRAQVVIDAFAPADNPSACAGRTTAGRKLGSRRLSKSTDPVDGREYRGGSSAAANRATVRRFSSNRCAISRCEIASAANARS